MFYYSDIKERNYHQPYLCVLLSFLGTNPSKFGAVVFSLGSESDLLGVEKYRTSTNNTFYKCMLCGKEFSMKGDMRRHVRIHTGEKPYKCPLCDVRVTQKQNLKKHIQYVHGNVTK